MELTDKSEQLTEKEKEQYTRLITMGKGEEPGFLMSQDVLEGSLSYLNTKEKEFFAFLLKNRLYEFTPIEISRMIGVTNKTVINRCTKLAANGFLIPIIVKTRVRSYQLSDFSRTNEKKILKRLSDFDFLFHPQK